MSRFHVGFEIELPFVRMSYHEILSNFSKTPAWCPHTTESPLAWSLLMSSRTLGINYIDV